jgi:hypothetical protein
MTGDEDVNDVPAVSTDVELKSEDPDGHWISST